MTEETASPKTALRAAIERAFQTVRHGYLEPDLIDALEREIGTLDRCLPKVREGEPIFVLRGQDKLAAASVYVWAQHAKSTGLSAQQYDRVLNIVTRMREYRPQKYPD